MIEVKRLLLATGLFVFSAFPVKAETWWLVGFASNPAWQIFTLPMENEQQCEVSGSKIVASAKAEALSRDIHRIGFVCVKGK